MWANDSEKLHVSDNNRDKLNVSDDNREKMHVSDNNREKLNVSGNNREKMFTKFWFGSRRYEYFDFGGIMNVLALAFPCENKY